jgi:hypothetical protein
MIIWLNNYLYNQSILNASYTNQLPVHRTLVLNIYDCLQGLGTYYKIVKQFNVYPRYSEEKLQKMVSWVYENIRPQTFAPSPAIPINDNFFNMLRRGYGYCDTDAQAFDMLAVMQGYKVHSVALYDIKINQSPHTLNEIYWNGKWIVLDPWKNIIFRNEQGQLLTVKDIISHPEVLHKYGYPDNITAETFRDSNLLYPFPLLSFGRIISKITENKQKIKQLNYFQSSSVAPKSQKEEVNVSQINKDKLRHTLILYNKARMADVLQKDLLAYKLYNQIAPIAGDSVFNQSVSFYKARALFNSGDKQEAIKLFNNFEVEYPESRWLPSVKYYLQKINE